MVWYGMVRVLTTAIHVTIDYSVFNGSTSTRSSSAEAMVDIGLSTYIVIKYLAAWYNGM
jgi:hypothetical protein